VSDTLNKKSLKFRKSFQKARMPQNRDAREEDVRSGEYYHSL
jgi:hypothetical protein